MATQRAYRYRFYPTAEQAGELARTFGCCRYVYNRALRAKSDACHGEGRTLSFAEASRMLTGWKREEETAWLKEVSSVPLQQALRHLENAYSGFFAGRMRFPRFKSKRHRQSATYTRIAFSYKVGDDVDGQPSKPILTLAKQSSPLKVRWSRPPPSAPRAVTVTLDSAGRYHVSLLCEEEIEQLPPAEKSVGIDLGITDLVATSDGWKSANPKHYRRDLRKLKRAQRDLA